VRGREYLDAFASSLGKRHLGHVGFATLIFWPVSRPFNIQGVTSLAKAKGFIRRF
jgi:hypothetical protein